MHEEIGADYTDMIYAATPEDIAMRRKAFIRNGGSSTARSPTASTKPAIVVHVAHCRRPNGAARDDECDRTAARGVQAPDQNTDHLPSAETAAMLFWALLASGQINMRKVDGWQHLPRHYRSAN